MNLEKLKNDICNTIDSYKDEILNCGEYILNNPELGYKEYKTSEYIRKKFAELNIPYTYPIALTGVKGKIKGKNNNLNVCIIGEMDAVKSRDHPYANPDTGSAHSCGHNIQIATLLGVAYGLTKSKSMENLHGDVTLLAAPAEEFIEVGERLKLKEANKITYLGGKQELIHQGAFDDVDIAIMIHSQANTPEIKLFTRGNSLGFVVKNIDFKGKAVHNAEPFEGINALNAAMLSLSGINANRETFSEKEKIRIHPIITKGGELINAIPANVQLETYIRGANINSINKGMKVVDNVVKGAAYMVGAKSNINTIKGYLPLNQNLELSSIVEKNALNFISEENIVKGEDMIGSTDMGDLSYIIPCIHPTIGGFKGAAHSKDFSTTNKQWTYITASKLLAMTVVDLLYNNASNGINIKNNFKPLMTKDEYLKYLNN